MNKSIFFKIAGCFLAILLAVYIVYPLTILLDGISAISGNNLLNTSDVVTFNLEKFAETFK